jgi:GntR family transcriptional repressor for pyruvate dehydrogenase complex
MFTPVDKKRAFESVVQQIETAIYRGDYAVGDYLPSERALVEDFAVGRSTVREALRILESQGLVKTSPGSRRGPQVCAAVTVGLTKMLNGAVRMEEIPLVELIQYRMISGSAANFLAARLRTDEHLERMRVAIEAMRAAELEDSTAFATADEDFHAVIRAASGNGLLDTVSEVIKSATLELVARTLDEAADSVSTRREFIDVHERILAAIADQDGVEAARLSRQTLFRAYSAELNAADQARLEILLGSDADTTLGI